MLIEGTFSGCIECPLYTVLTVLITRSD